eukprot:jgi/Mesvir1/12686/Mv24096-RA.1
MAVKRPHTKARGNKTKGTRRHAVKAGEASGSRDARADGNGALMQLKGLPLSRIMSFLGEGDLVNLGLANKAYLRETLEHRLDEATRKANENRETVVRLDEPLKRAQREQEVAEIDHWESFLPEDSPEYVEAQDRHNFWNDQVRKISALKTPAYVGWYRNLGKKQLLEEQLGIPRLVPRPMGPLPRPLPSTHSQYRTYLLNTTIPGGAVVDHRHNPIATPPNVRAELVDHLRFYDETVDQNKREFQRVAAWRKRMANTRGRLAKDLVDPPRPWTAAERRSIRAMIDNIDRHVSGEATRGHGNDPVPPYSEAQWRLLESAGRNARMQDILRRYDANPAGGVVG